MRVPRRPAAIAASVMLGAALLLAGGCAGLTATADPGATPSLPGPGWPAAAAGAACGLLEFGQVEHELGIRFDTAGGAHVADTYTCALTGTGPEFPDLTLSLSATTADDLIFAISVAPSGSTVHKGLGRAAYELRTPATAGHGPILEIGWLSAKPRLMLLRYTFPAGAADADVDALAPKLLTLAQRVEQAS